jgi:hypothetical protein
MVMQVLTTLFIQDMKVDPEGYADCPIGSFLELVSSFLILFKALIKELFEA